jgi:Lipopolysaccharide kinase (Kdo/WaaP) family
MLTENLTWGALPEGFTKITDGRGHRLIVRQDRMADIDCSVCSDDPDPLEDCGYRGRSALRALTLPDGETALIRRYQHGGFFRALTGAWFFSWPPRPFRELAITEELRRRGLRTVEVYAACVGPTKGPFYRGWLVTRQLSHAEDLWSALQSGLVERVGLRMALQAVADSVRAMHREGLYHGDLNLKNILLRLENGAVAGYIIDFDKSKLFLGQVPPELAKKNLARLLRSARKLDPEEKYLPAAAWNEFVALYHGDQHA